MKSRRLKNQDDDERTSDEGEKEVLHNDESDCDKEVSWKDESGHDEEE